MKTFCLKFLLLAALAFLLFQAETNAQYFNIGQRPASQRWRMITSDSLRMVFPKEYERNARRSMYYMEQSRGHLQYGFKHGVMRTPVMFSTQNFASNGMAMLAPKRIEMFAIPPSDIYSEPWLKQLAIHEYRHMVQYSNINRSTVRVFSYILGQQAPFAATALIPFWFIEGDAVMAETQASEFGRGLQPSFSMHYRALGEDIFRETGYWKADKWFAGSMKHFVPSHYELGYQMVAHSMRKYDPYIGQELYRFASNYPFLFATTQLALSRSYDTSTLKLFRATFRELNDYWSSLPERDDSATVLNTPITSYTTYSHPQYLDDSTILAVKSDYDVFSRFVVVDTENSTERTVMHTGNISTRPAVCGGRIWWTEYRQSTLWEQRINSQLCYADVGEWKTHVVRGADRVLFPTPVGGALPAYVEYDYSGTYAIVCGDHRYEFPAGMSVHGMDWDDATQKLYAICLDDRGMGIMCYSPSEELAYEVTNFSHITLSGLRAGDGKLYFGSVASGYDEIHMIDLSTLEESRITESRYGSFAAAPSPDGGSSIALTVYDRGGYKLAVQPSGAYSDHMFDHKSANNRAFTAKNIVNPQVPSWNVGEPLMADMVFTDKEYEESVAEHSVRRFNRALRVFNIHSWFPLNFDPRDTDANSDLAPTYLGVTLLSQSLLGDMQTTARYGYLEGGKSLVSASLTYSGLPVRFSGSFTWSDRNQFYIRPYSDLDSPTYFNNYLEASGMAYVPMLLSSGYKVRWLTPAVEYKFRNTLVYDVQNANGGYKEGEHRFTASVQFSEQVRMAELDIYPRWGYTVRGLISANAGRTSQLFTNSWAMIGRIYTPGFARHHGFTLAAGYQNSFGDGTRYAYIYDLLVPHGFSGLSGNNYSALAATYQFPLCYPDAGPSGLIFIKRIRLAASFEAARYKSYYITSANTIADRYDTVYTSGVSLYFDVGLFRLPAQSTTTIIVSVYFPQGKDPYVSAGFSIPF